MTMTYDTLNGAKGSAGAIATWVNYTKLDTPTIIDEAQTLIYQTLRTREMRVSVQFTLNTSAFSVALPNASTGQFLEPLLLRDITNGVTLIPNDERYLSYEKLEDIRQWTGGVPTSGQPNFVAIYNEAFQFDVSASAPVVYELVYYLRPALLATGAPQNANFLTTRYPHLLRTACMASAADFMKDSEEYNKLVTRLGQLIDAVNKGPDPTTSAGAQINNTPALESSLLSVIPTATAPIDSVFLEAQALAFSKLRVREMRVSTTVTLNSGQSSVALPQAASGQFLEIVSMHDDTNAQTLIPNDQQFVSERRLLSLRQFTGGVLNTGTPTYVAIFGEAFQFDVKANQNTNYTVVYYQRPANLANRDASNFLTLRYPQVLRTAAQAALADYRQDSDAHQKALTRLEALCQNANAESAALDTKLISSEINKPNVEATLLNFIGETTAPVAAMLTEAQAIIYSKLRVREMRVSTTLSLGIGFNSVALPGAAAGNFLEVISLHDDTDSIGLIPDDERFVSEQRLVRLRTATQGIPQHVSIYNEAFQFDAPANATTSYTCVFYQRPAFLTSPSSSNFLSLRYPQILRAGTQVALANFKHDAAARTAAMQTLDALIDVANKEAELVHSRGTWQPELTQPIIEGSLLSFFADSTVPAQAILAEAQVLIYSKLRAREMLTSSTLSLTNGNSSVLLPGGGATGTFLEVVALHDDTNARALIPNDNAYVGEQRLLSLRTYTGGVLNSGTPSYVSIFNEAFQFDVQATGGPFSYTCVFYQRPALLTSPSSSNFLSVRYPAILRTGIQAALADFKRDSAAHEAALKRLDELITVANAEVNAVAAKGTLPDLTKAPIDATLINFIQDNQAPVQAILIEAQALAYSRLRVREMRVSTPLTLALNTNTIALPGSATGQFLEPIALYDSTGTITFIPNDQRYVSQQRMLQLQGGSLGSGVPSFVAIYNENLVFDVNASPLQNFTMVSYQRPANLANQNSSNFLTFRYPHILRAAAQVAVADFKRDVQGRKAALEILDALCAEANAEAAQADQQRSLLNQPVVEGTQTSLIPATSTPLQQVFAEAQQLLYGILRCREMMTELSFTMPINSAYIALPARFLEPIGPIQTTSFNSRIRHKDSNWVQSNRNYTETTGLFSANPFTTTSGSNLVNVFLSNHGFAQDSVINITGATLFNGVTLNGTFPISAIVDANDFTIDISILGTPPNATGSGGGAAATYLCDNLTAGTPYWFAIWNERLNFEQAFFQTTICKMQYFQALPLLTSQEQTNFLTNRYPDLLRVAMQAAEANMKRDRKSYETLMNELTPLVQAVNAENEMQFRGSEIDPWIP